jgi:hypothetical protein
MADTFASNAVFDRMRMMLELFDDSEIEAGMARMLPADRERLARCIRRASEPAQDNASPIDHSECVTAGDSVITRAHTHEGVTGAWLFPDDFSPDGTVKGLYDESPTGAGF